ncbi:MAG: acyltransferase [Chloroflexi bacterium]|nr:acyltransferase [Chloroflexota bacterium]
MDDKQNTNKAMNVVLGFLLPSFASLYLVVFSYANNATIISLGSIWNILALLIAISISVYLVWFFIHKREVYAASLAAFIFMLAFLMYGNAYKLLATLDFFPVRHFTLLPLFVLVSFYFGWLISKLNPELLKKIWLVVISILSLLILFNLIKTIPIEIQKKSQFHEIEPITINNNEAKAPGKHDIYWLVFDEMAGFDVVRDYFQYPEIDDYIEELESLGFNVIEGARSINHYTLHQIATRLNYERYPMDYTELDYYPYITNNKVMNELTSRAYTTVILDETRSESYGIPAKPPIPADIDLEDYINVEYPSSSFLGSFGALVARQTMLMPLNFLYNPAISEIAIHNANILFVAHELESIEIPSPKFVYTHLLLPHKPFMFDENGEILESSSFTNWNHYFGQYKFTLKVIQSAIKTILANANPDYPPVIILQSDHGARNLQDLDFPKLENYSDENIGSIVFAIYAPACPDLPLEDGMDPINTFPIVFNYLFDMKIPLQ